ncbi:ATP-binding cassette domain-containing protein [Vibrio parahaemolyticus]|nr:ATP-binding cassette domain-containing protein [Vibrio parahaemolyticus]MDN4719108.1 ATP-binding cassette domain-containing protein [Vibrio parahaemolyticus]
MSELARDIEPAEILLSVNNIEVVYDEVILVLRGVSLEVPKGQIVTLLGANGAGKSTTLKAISGLLKTEDGEVTRGKLTSWASVSTTKAQKRLSVRAFSK